MKVSANYLCLKSYIVMSLTSCALVDFLFTLLMLSVFMSAHRVCPFSVYDCRYHCVRLSVTDCGVTRFVWYDCLTVWA